MEHQTRSSGLESAWGVSLALAGFALGVVLMFSSTHGGLGLGIRDGSFVALQGRASAPVSYSAAVAWYSSQIILALSGALTVVLSLPVFIRNGSVRLAQVIGSADPVSRGIRQALRLAAASAALGLLCYLAVIVRRLFSY